MSFESDIWQISYFDQQKQISPGDEINTADAESKSRKLAINLIQVFSLYWTGSGVNVVYVGSDSGHAISIASVMFPSLKFLRSSIG